MPELSTSYALVGMTQDSTFGPAVAVGQGGVFVEWTTASEEGTAGFRLLRRNARTVIRHLDRLRAQHLDQHVLLGQQCRAGLRLVGDQSVQWAGRAHFVTAAADSYHHQSGSCKMGSDDMAVVDPRLRVRGAERL